MAQSAAIEPTPYRTSTMWTLYFCLTWHNPVDLMSIMQIKNQGSESLVTCVEFLSY